MKRLFLLLLFISKISFSQELSIEKKEFDKIYAELDNTNKWGKEDYIGTLNYITEDKILSSLKIPERGISVSLSFNLTGDSTKLNSSKFDELSKFNYKPLAVDFKGYNWIIDEYKFSYHGFTHSHMDGLSHLSNNGIYYNSHTKPENLGVENYSKGIISKGVLIDIPLLKNKEFIESGYKISINDILEFEKKFNLEIESGDILLIRTGRWKEKEINGDWDFPNKSVGLHYKVMTLLGERKISVLGSDGTNDSNPPLIKEEGSPVHKIALVAMGMPLLDNLNLEDLSKKCKELNQWEFLLLIQPLKFEGGTGSPINSIAIF